METVSAVAFPCLLIAYRLLQAITDAIQDVKMSKHQLENLRDTAKLFLDMLSNEYKVGRLLEDTTEVALEHLNKVLRDISTFAQAEKQAACRFLRAFLSKNERLVKIEIHYRKLVVAVQAFSVVSLINIQYWQQRNDAARSSDQLSLHKYLEELKADPNCLLEKIAAKREDLDAMTVAIRRHLAQNSNQDEETRFLRETVKIMQTASGRVISIKKWTITSYDVKFKEKLTWGGFGEVWRGSWHGTQVALKKLRKDGTIRGSDYTREIEVWSTLAHPHILEFFGANVLDDDPFIVMPYYRNGNARDYIQRNPDCNRIKILYDISLGLIYLHSQRVTHGDLKAMNVLIGDDERAVLSDFGLSEFGRNANPRATKDCIYGSRLWMSPERLEGMSPEPPSDVYAFGMTMFEIYTNETPFSDLSTEFTQRVTEGLRPERPRGDKKSAIPNEIWDLAVTCWAHKPSERPIARNVRDTIHYILQLTSVEKPEAQGKLRNEVGILQQEIAKLERAQVQELQEARRQVELKDQELLKLRAGLSSITQTLREELSTMKKHLEEAEETLRRSEARCQELQKSEDFLLSIAGALSNRAHEVLLARHQAEAKDREVQEMQQKFLSFAGKHSSDIQEAKPEENARPAEMDTIPDPQRELDSDRQDRDPNLQPNKSPIPHPPKSIPEGFESPIDGHQTIGLHEKLRKNVDDGLKPPVLLPHPADSLWHLNVNPWNDNHGHEGPSEDKSRDQLAVGTDGDPRHLPSHHKVENIQRTNEPQVGATGYAQNLSVRHPTADEEDQSEVWDNVVPLLAPTPPKTFKHLAEGGKPNANDVHSELEVLQIDLPQLPLESYQKAAIISQPTRPSVESPVRLPGSIRLSQQNVPASDANATFPSFRPSSQQLSNQNPVIPLSLSRSSPYIRPQSIPPSVDPPIPVKPSTPTLSSSLPTPLMMAHSTTTIGATSSFTQPSATSHSQLHVPSSDAGPALPSLPKTSLQGSSNQGPATTGSLSQWSPYDRAQPVPPSDDPPIPIKPSTGTHSSSVPLRPMTARDVTTGFTQSSAAILFKSHVSSSELSAVHTSSFKASSPDSVLSHSNVWSSHVPSQRASSSSDTPIPIKPSTPTPSSVSTSLPTATTPTGTKDGTAGFAQSSAALHHVTSSDAKSPQGYSNQVVSLARQSSSSASLQTDPNSRFLQQAANRTGILGSSERESGSGRKSTLHAPRLRQAQSQPQSNYTFQPQPSTGVGSSFTDSPPTTFSRPIDPSDNQSSSPLPNVTMTPPKPASTDHGAYGYSRALPTTGFKEEAGLDEGQWRS